MFGKLMYRLGGLWITSSRNGKCICILNKRSRKIYSCSPIIKKTLTGRYFQRNILPPSGLAQAV
jgi:hypothetical protein